LEVFKGYILTQINSKGSTPYGSCYFISYQDSDNVSKLQLTFKREALLKAQCKEMPLSKKY
jgi:hypothetical protein